MSKARQLLEKLKRPKTQQNLFEEFLGESKAKLLQEVLIQLAKGKGDSQFGNIVILAGGAGSGKGVVLSNMIDIQGKVFDVDKLKSMVIDSKFIASQIKKEKGIDVSKLNLKNPDEVSKLHELVAELGLEKTWKDAMYKSVLLADPERKPNLVFDVTLKSPDKLDEIAEQVSYLGYDKTKTHIVWVVNDVEVAIEQNAKRSRTVSDRILLATHSGVANTIRSILHPAYKIRDIVDGRIVFAFNKAKVDNTIEKTDKKQSTVFKNKTAQGFYVKNSDYVVIKEAGQEPKQLDQIGSQFIQKIVQYIPKSVVDGWERELEKSLSND